MVFLMILTRLCLNFLCGSSWSAPKVSLSNHSHTPLAISATLPGFSQHSVLMAPGPVSVAQKYLLQFPPGSLVVTLY